jgi:hypothetical protein
MVKTKVGKAFLYGLFTCVSFYAYSAFTLWRGFPDFILVLTLGKGFLAYYMLAWGTQGDNYPLLIGLSVLTFIFDYLLISGIWYLGLIVSEKLKAK